MKSLLKEMEWRIVRSFLDIAILSILEGNEDLNGYEILAHINEKLGILVSSGTVYSTLHALERKKLIEEMSCSRSRTYKLTLKGQAKLKEIDNVKETFKIFLEQFLKIL